MLKSILHDNVHETCILVACFAETLYFRIIKFLLFQQLLIHGVDSFCFFIELVAYQWKKEKNDSDNGYNLKQQRTMFQCREEQVK